MVFVLGSFVEMQGSPIFCWEKEVVMFIENYVFLYINNV